MIKKIKKFLLNSNKQNKKGLILALLFFIIIGLVFSPQLVSAQASGSTIYLANPGSSTNASSEPQGDLIPGLNCGWLNPACTVAGWILSAIIKIVVLVVFGIPLILSAAAAGVTGLILGWVISPDFISLKFTQNPFVDAGLSITRGFANMGFILFLVVIALATVLRIEEYKAKKTLTTLIIIALLINFSPVFCGIIIDFSNIVMNYFLSAITGINGFINFIRQSAYELWNLVWTSGLDLGKVIAAAMQVMVSVVFNFFCAFIFILFSALFTMRYIMLWVLVIISPVAFVSYILPITRRGKSILNWNKWLEQLIEWCVVGITGGFFLYLGFFMIDMISAKPSMFTKQPNSGGLGLMNSILPYLIPLILLWIAYKEIKKTSAMFAREVIEIPEKVTKAAVSAAAMAGMAVATAGVGAAAGAAGGIARGIPGTLGQARERIRKYGESPEHEHGLGGAVARTITSGTDRFAGWAKTAQGVPGAAKEDLSKLKERYEGFKEEHPRIGKIADAGEKIGKETGGWMYRQAKASLDAVLHGYTKEEKIKGRELHPIEKEQGIRYKEVTGIEKIPFSPEERKQRLMIMPDGSERKLTKTDLDKGYVEEEAKMQVATDQKLTKEEIESGHIINVGRKRAVTIPSVGDAFRKGFEEIEKKYISGVKSLTEELREEALSAARRDLEGDLKGLSDETKEKLRSAFTKYREWEDQGRSIGRDELEELEKSMKKKRKKSDSESESSE